uniref:Early endosome antigen 1 (Trinotate prediction) n=1 Tax=Henneguya salminicola TaxID=69463 RepID=A0A6G3MHJ2_HENSL
MTGNFNLISEKYNNLIFEKNNLERVYNDSLTSITNLSEKNLNLAKQIKEDENQISILESKFQTHENKSRESMLALCELGAENQRLQTVVASLQGKQWKNENDINKCELCFECFTLTNRKHHCRLCGGVYCNDCCKNMTSLPSHKKMVRVCNICFENISNINS